MIEMDPDIEIMHVVESGRLKPSSLIKIHLSSEYNRKIPTATVNGLADGNNETVSVSLSDSQESSSAGNKPHKGKVISVDEIWTHRLSENPRLFNATKFRVHHISTSKNGDETVDMFLGVTDYKEYLGTNWAPHVKELHDMGRKLENNSQAFLSDALGVGASVITKDDFVILLRRSEHCAEAPAMWDIPGGHAEPKNIVGDKTLEEIDVSAMDDNAVLFEVFDSIVQEVKDEVNIPLDQLGEPLYVGTHRNTTSGGRPSLAFKIRCSLTSGEVRRLYNQGSQQEADESTKIMFVPADDIPTLDSQRRDLWGNLAPSAKGNLTCYCIAHGLKKL